MSHSKQRRPEPNGEGLQGGVGAERGGEGGLRACLESSEGPPLVLVVPRGTLSVRPPASATPFVASPGRMFQLGSDNSGPVEVGVSWAISCASTCKLGAVAG